MLTVLTLEGDRGRDVDLRHTIAVRETKCLVQVLMHPAEPPPVMVVSAVSTSVTRQLSARRLCTSIVFLPRSKVTSVNRRKRQSECSSITQLLFPQQITKSSMPCAEEVHMMCQRIG